MMHYCIALARKRLQSLCSHRSPFTVVGSFFFFFFVVVLTPFLLYNHLYISIHIFCVCTFNSVSLLCILSLVVVDRRRRHVNYSIYIYLNVVFSLCVPYARTRAHVYFFFCLPFIDNVHGIQLNKKF